MRNVIDVNLDAKCKRCGEGGATQNGMCIKCTTKALKNGEFYHLLKPIHPHLKPTPTNKGER